MYYLCSNIWLLFVSCSPGYSLIMKHIIYIALATLLLCACSRQSDAEKALARVEKAEALALAGNLHQAKIEADSVHQLFPMEVAVRRRAKALQDSIVYVEAERNLVYSDSLLQTLLPQVEPLMKKFRYEKNEKYESNGRYVHRLLVTDSNMSRCYLQCYITDARQAILKSYYFGTSQLLQNALELSAEEQVVRYDGEGHGFDAGGYHSILTFEGDKALEILNFISSNTASRIRVNLLGINARNAETNTVYYLTDSEKVALVETYQLGLLFSDIRRLEDQIRISSLQIEKYQHRQLEK